MENKNVKIVAKENQEAAIIPESGNLGLLALGAVGMKLWREARDKIEKEREEAKSTEKEAKKKK